MDLSLERAQPRAQDERLADALGSTAPECFMDMVSYGIRDPLLVVLQLAEKPSSLLKDMKSNTSQNAGDDPTQHCIENIHNNPLLWISSKANPQRCPDSFQTLLRYAHAVIDRCGTD